MSTQLKPPPGHFTVLYFAAATSYTRREHDFFPVRGDGVPVTQLFTLLEGKYAGIREKVLESCALTVNLEYVDLEEDAAMMVKEGDEVGIIPPVSSG